MTRLKGLISWFNLVGLLALAGCQQDWARPERIRLKLGDQPAWAALNWNGQGWEATNGTSHQQIFWLRFRIRLDAAGTAHKPLGLKIISLGSFEAFWDGRLIGHNGQVGRTKALERPGHHATCWLLPDSDAKPGLHVLALSVSNFYARTGYSFYNRSGN
ncbi:hypothetical protein EXU85_26000 [Spirosoma sp. KCTC 42546]|uniref:hypothetical protein n=1 Tax=Spirosoma sp. KCTC 42546 TaxID=2520506 RepID=UPI00115733F9|nr:hypothetical protein [Spirosoma sp. KCTC 42546]QDK81875.1 hypothetical protein EXU85_26000 [Spirosoma sp. KCTC 42546]